MEKVKEKEPSGDAEEEIGGRTSKEVRPVEGPRASQAGRGAENRKEKSLYSLVMFQNIASTEPRVQARTQWTEWCMSRRRRGEGAKSTPTLFTKFDSKGKGSDVAETLI